jgi:hypothetical protein
MSKEKAKRLSICFGNYKNDKMKIIVKNLPAHYFVSAQGKAETTWGSQGMLCSGTGAYNKSLQIFAKLIGQKIRSVSCLNCESTMTGKEMMREKILALYFLLQQTLQSEWREKNKSELMMMMISDTGRDIDG